MEMVGVIEIEGNDTAAECPVDTGIAVIAGRWKLLLLRPLYLNGTTRYNQLLKLVPGITAKELTRNLRELEYAGLVRRSAGADGVVAYQLTELGRSLGTTFKSLGEFGTAYLRSRRPAMRTGAT
jgi:DNA-binding HxlR family transcriptional regulator